MSSTYDGGHGRRTGSARMRIAALAFTRLRAAFGVALLALAALVPAGAQEHAPIENLDYVVIPDGQPWQPLQGRIEVVEVFSYGCVHCFHFQRLMDAWTRTQAEDVRVTYVPAVFSAGDTFARGFFAAQTLGLQHSTHHAVFSAVHERSRLPRSGAGIDAIAGFYAEHGAPSQAAFRAAMTSPATEEKLNAAKAFAIRSGVQGTPTLIINGRYRVTARSLDDTLAIADQLIARERAAR